MHSTPTRSCCVSWPRCVWACEGAFVDCAPPVSRDCIIGSSGCLLADPRGRVMSRNTHHTPPVTHHTCHTSYPSHLPHRTNTHFTHITSHTHVTDHRARRRRPRSLWAWPKRSVPWPQPRALRGTRALTWSGCWGCGWNLQRGWTHSGRRCVFVSVSAERLLILLGFAQISMAAGGAAGTGGMRGGAEGGGGGGCGAYQ